MQHLFGIASHKDPDDRGSLQVGKEFDAAPKMSDLYNDTMAVLEVKTRFAPQSFKGNLS